jgi:hypothetical protein
MEGTSSPHTVVHWAKVCIRIVQWSRDVDPDSYERILTSLVARIDYGVLDLLRDLGCEEETLQHFDEKMRHGHYWCCNHSARHLGDFVPTSCTRHG